MSIRLTPLGRMVVPVLVLVGLIGLNGWLSATMGRGPWLDVDKVFHLAIGIVVSWVFYYLLRQKHDAVPHYGFFGAGMMLGASGWFPLVSQGLLFSALPDWDITLFGIGSHRNPAFHSALIPFFLVIGLLHYRGMRDFAIGLSVGVCSHLLVDLCQSASSHPDWYRPNFYPIVRGMYGPFAVLWMLGNALIAAGLAYGAAGRQPALVRMEREGFE
ncbi:MAG: hypothetical protein HY816_22775 [Candidatus Wallbacteria bacterium]|nr:hypothetical protein [Candidatus Wallbacteria bacterium]